MQKVLVPLVAALCLGLLGFVFYLFTTSENKTIPQAQVPQNAPNRPPPVMAQPGPKVGEPAPSVFWGVSWGGSPRPVLITRTPPPCRSRHPDGAGGPR